MRQKTVGEEDHKGHEHEHRAKEQHLLQGGPGAGVDSDADIEAFLKSL